MANEGKGENFSRLVEVMQALLAPDGCPWDREQSFQTLRSYVIEEAYEVVDAIDKGDFVELREELGDLLLQVVFQAELARDAGLFGPNEIIDGICDKLIRRHPHVFEDAHAGDSQEALRNWEARKAEEKKNRGRLDGVPKHLPALLRAFRIGEKASSVGYDWPDAQAVRDKVDEELSEMDTSLVQNDQAAFEQELGDVLFALCSLARHRGVDPENALRATLCRFSERFAWVEQQCHAVHRVLGELTDAERDALWEQAKDAKG